jgi:SdrD B-like domain
MHLLRRLFSRKRASDTHSRTQFRPSVELLEAREVPAVTLISSTFNGTAIPADSSVWFSSVGKISGVGADPVTIRLTDATITSGNFTVTVPDSVITISSAVTTATTEFNAQTNTWMTSLPLSGFSGNVFLAGATLPVPDGLPGGIKPVVWQADFTTDTPGVNIKWQWAAAVYTTFGADYNALGVKPVDGSAANPYPNSHHAGTPENFKDYVVGGARGGGGSNFTGSLSATKSVTPSPANLSSLSGFVYLDANFNGVKDDNELGIGGVEILLQGTDDQGQDVFRSVTTDQNGHYSFTNLRAGTYSLQEFQPSNYSDGMDSIGTQGGLVDSDLDLLHDIVLAAGVDGRDNNFGELFPD